jgi:signal transduction histidine kinase
MSYCGADGASRFHSRQLEMGGTRRGVFKKGSPMTSQSLSKTRSEANGEPRSDGELLEANQHMREFLNVLGHELRSPLAAIGNGLHILQLQGDDAAAREWVCSMIQRQTQCLRRLVEDLLEVSRIEHGQIRLRKQPLDLGQTVARAVETVRASVESRGHQIEVALPPEPVALDADPARLEQVLTNLLNNAAKYMEPGGRIWVTAEVQGGDVILRVQDSGIGMDAEMLPHVFDPFWQVERTLDHSQGGLGIGLALVRKLAEMHGGSARAYSAGLGRGSEFVVCLPTLQHVG